MLYNVKAGIIGLDELGRTYAHLIKDHIKNLNLIAAYGRTQKELLFAKNDLSLEYVYSDEKALIENHDIDLIFIFSDPDRRPHQAIQAIEAGKHIFLLNPMAMNLDDAQAVNDVARSHPSQVVMASSIIRFMPLLQLVQENIRKGEIGIINHITIDSTFVSSINKTHKRDTGSVFLNYCVDEIDLSQWIMQDVFTKVSVEAKNDTTICHAETQNKSSLNLIVQPKIDKGQSYMTIYGNKGQIIVSNTNNKAYKLFGENGEKRDVFIDQSTQFIFPEYLQLHHFTRVILGREKPLVTTAHGVDIVRLAVAFEKSKVLEQDVVL